MRRFQKAYRRGASAIQMAVVLAVIAMATVATVRTMSRSTTTQLNVTSEGLADPAALRRHFDSKSSDSGSDGSSSSDSGSGYN